MITSGRSLATLCWSLVLALGVVDYATGYEASFSYFYLLPVCLSAWFGGASQTALIAAGSALTWQFANDLAGEPHSSVWIALWNDLLQLLFFLTVGLMLRRIRTLLHREKRRSRSDWLTGLLNRRAFQEVFERELARLGRNGTSLLIGYVDLDHFKKVNDSRGHAEGDRVLQAVAGELKDVLRRSDVVARVGGDEFAFLLPDTPLRHIAPVADKLLKALQTVSAKNDWPVGASIGVLEIQTGAIPSLEEALSAADGLMYEAKLQGRGRVRTGRWTGGQRALAVS